jgi:hypothetical protein
MATVRPWECPNWKTRRRRPCPSSMSQSSPPSCIAISWCTLHWPWSPWGRGWFRLYPENQRRPGPAFFLRHMNFCISRTPLSFFGTLFWLLLCFRHVQVHRQFIHGPNSVQDNSPTDQDSLRRSQTFSTVSFFWPSFRSLGARQTNVFIRPRPSDWILLTVSYLWTRTEASPWTVCRRPSLTAVATAATMSSVSLFFFRLECLWGNASDQVHFFYPYFL